MVITEIINNELSINSITDLFGVDTVNVFAKNNYDTVKFDFIVIVNPINDPPRFSLDTNYVELIEDFVDTLISITSLQG